MYNSHYNIFDFNNCWIKSYYYDVCKSYSPNNYYPCTLFYWKLQLIKSKNLELDYSTHGSFLIPLINKFHVKKSLCLLSIMGLSRLEF